jgi:hypothetical protein
MILKKFIYIIGIKNPSLHVSIFGFSIFQFLTSYSNIPNMLDYSDYLIYIVHFPKSILRNHLDLIFSFICFRKKHGFPPSNRFSITFSFFSYSNPNYIPRYYIIEKIPKISIPNLLIFYYNLL